MNRKIEDLGLTPSRLKELKKKCNEIRKEIIKIVYRAQSGHIGGSLGSTEIVVSLYYHLMNHDPKNPRWQNRDRFILSKGHCTPLLYSVLADCGYFPKDDLKTFRRPGSHLQGHPCQPKTPGLEATTGALGIGFSTALGMALTAKNRSFPHANHVDESSNRNGWHVLIVAMISNRKALNRSPQCSPIFALDSSNFFHDA